MTGETKTILIADDDHSICRLVEAIVKREGHEVEVCQNGEQLLKALKSKKVHLIICDEMMPLLKGSSIAEYLRKEPEYREIPFILFSAEENSKLFTDLLQRKIIDIYLPKPINTKQLIAMIFLCLNRKNNSKF